MTVTRFVVGSLNPIKLEAVRRGAVLIYDEVDVRAIAVPSGVSAQPFGDEEMISGATQRAREVLNRAMDADYGVGLEGGVLELNEGLFACAWCAIANRAGRIGVASTGRFLLPESVANLVRSGIELGDADDQVFGRSNSKQQEGAVGILTHGQLTRAQFYAPAVLLALVRFINHEHYA
jgi:inosine/xanthosine triphosphatase